MKAKRPIILLGGLIFAVGLSACQSVAFPVSHTLGGPVSSAPVQTTGGYVRAERPYRDRYGAVVYPTTDGRRFQSAAARDEYLDWANRGAARGGYGRRDRGYSDRWNDYGDSYDRNADRKARKLRVEIAEAEEDVYELRRKREKLRAQIDYRRSRGLSAREHRQRLFAIEDELAYAETRVHELRRLGEVRTKKPRKRRYSFDEPARAPEIDDRNRRRQEQRTNRQNRPVAIAPQRQQRLRDDRPARRVQVSRQDLQRYAAYRKRLENDEQFRTRIYQSKLYSAESGKPVTYFLELSAQPRDAK